MSLRLSRFFAAAAAAAFVILESPAAFACTQGNSYCQGGYLYICRCWTATGCSWTYSGTCLRDDPPEPPAATPDPAALLDGPLSRAPTRPMSRRLAGHRVH